MGGTERSPEQITELAREGDPAALQTVQMFCAMLGTVAGNLALTLGARGGIYLAGGILPAITGLFSESGFRTRFEAKGRFANYLADVPTYIITRPYPALLGLDIYLRHRQASIAHRLPR
jgi:glucokinase